MSTVSKQYKNVGVRASYPQTGGELGSPFQEDVWKRTDKVVSFGLYVIQIALDIPIGSQSRCLSVPERRVIHINLRSLGGATRSRESPLVGRRISYLAERHLPTHRTMRIMAKSTSNWTRCET